MYNYATTQKHTVANCLEIKVAHHSEEALVKLEDFDAAIRMCCSFLGIQEMYCEQRKILWEFFNGKNVYFSAYTGYGKSLIYQAILIISDILNDNLVGASTVLVISPLTSLIQDQVNHINKNFGISAVAIVSGQDEELLVNIEDGTYSLVYTSPESFLSNKRWRSLATSQNFREGCVAIVIDEAHCLAQW